MQLKSAESHLTFCDTAILPTRTEPAVIPVRVVAAQLNFKASQPVALDPIRERHRISIVRLVARKVTPIKWVQAADQMPHGQVLRGMQGEEIGRVFVAESARVGIVRREELFEIVVQELRSVRFEYRRRVQPAVRIVQRNIERRATYERGQIRQMSIGGPIAIEIGQQLR